jgi:hypothetical protein
MILCSCPYNTTAPWRWLQSAVETCRGENTKLGAVAEKKSVYKTPARNIYNMKYPFHLSVWLASLYHTRHYCLSIFSLHSTVTKRLHGRHYSGKICIDIKTSQYIDFKSRLQSGDAPPYRRSGRPVGRQVNWGDKFDRIKKKLGLNPR